MSNAGPNDKRIIDVSNNDGSIRCYINDADNHSICASHSENPIFPKTPEFKITQAQKAKENRTEEEKED
tara:strand:+ start:353 stop:559 length:207 start_codon:yes stop_codon:yes gene_type:complete